MTRPESTKRTYITRATVAMALLLAASCGSDSAGPGEPTVASVEVAGPQNQIVVDETLQLTATAKDADGNVIPGRTFVWSSNNEGVASVTSGGLVRGVSGGPATISATTGNRTGSFAVEVAALEPLVVNAVTPNPLVPGQPATIAGTGFSAVPQSNTVTIAGAPATVSAATTTSLTVIVPPTLCAAGSAPVMVRVGTRSSNAFPAPAQSAGTSINLATGQQVVLTDPAGFCLRFGASAATESYLVGVQSVSETGTLLTGVRFASTTAGGAPAQAAPLAHATTTTPATPPAMSRAFERWQRHHAAEAEQRRADTEVFGPYTARIAEYHAARAAARADARTAAIPATITVGEKLGLRVLTGTTCSQFASITATVRAIAPSVVILTDDANPANGYSTADLEDLAAYFDQTVYPTNVAHFGAVSDIDGNGRIAIVVTRRANERGNLLGFVTTADLDPQCQAGNQAEILYIVTPDPTGSLGFQYSVAEARADSRWLLAHEFTHIIQNNRRTLMGRQRLADWQSEGQATYAELVVGLVATGREPGQNYGFNVIFNCSNPPGQQCSTPIDPYDFFIFTFFDLVLYYGFNLTCNPNVPNDCQTPVAGAPEQCTWVAGETGHPCHNREVYGVPAVFLTWLTDQFGPTFPGGRDGLHRQLLDLPQIGFSAVAALTGESMGQLLAQWAAALYTDDRVQGLDPRLQFTSWNLFDMGSRLIDAANLTPRQRGFTSFSNDVTVRGGSTAYFLLSGAGRTETAVRVRRTDESPLPAGMQVFVVRVQ